jgi:hypothetical protein
MIVRYLVAVAVVGANLLVVSSGLARETTLSRKEIRSMPILERPSRLGHFYGNTVRRNAMRSAQFTGTSGTGASQETLVPDNNPGLRD